MTGSNVHVSVQLARNGTASRSRLESGWFQASRWLGRLLFALGALVLSCTVLANGVARPNIMFMVVEDLGPRIGAYGDPLARTPNIDRLAADGVRFTNVFTTSGVCAPSRAALITGMHQQAIGAQHMRTSSFGRSRDGALGTFSTPGPAYEAVPPAFVKAFPERLRAAGYFTMNNAKTDYQFGEPFTIWDRSGDAVSLADRDPDRPFFFMLSHFGTHESGMFRRGFADRFEWSERIFALNDAGLARLEERTDPARVAVPAYLPDTPEVRRDIARHYDNIAVMDLWVGERLEELRVAGLLDETVVIWTTDHGDGLPRAKRSIYDSGLRVPFIVRLPNRERAGTVDARLVSFVDLAPTLLGLAGAPVPPHLHGQDFLDEAVPGRRYVYAARDRLDELPDRSRAVRDSRFKYIRNYLPERPLLGPLYFRENLGAMAELRRLHREQALAPALARYLEPSRPAEELYDLAEDPDEMRNRIDAPAYRDELRRLREALDGWLKEVGDMSAQPEVDMVTKLMWPGGKQPVTQAPVFAVDCSGPAPIVELRAATPGSSLGWRHAGAPFWSLYSGPLETVPFGARLEAKAVRYGYRESEVAAASLCADEGED